MLVACGSKTPQTVEGFTQIMETSGFDVQDITDDAETDSLARSVFAAVGDDYQIDFLEFADSEIGEDYFDNKKEMLEDEHRSKSFSLSVSVGNYNYYAFNAKDDFYLIAQIDNTMLYCVADKEYRSEITEFVKTLGYRYFPKIHSTDSRGCNKY